jgi:hypothetical protein
MSDIRNDKLRQAHDRLTEAVESITSGDDWKRPSWPSRPGR